MNNDFFIFFPNEIIFTNQLDPKITSKQQKYHVENDFYINIGKHGNPQKTYKRKDTTKDAEIQIYGLDTLLTEDNQQWDKFIEDIITPITNDWSISSKKLNGKYCLIITCNADELNDDFSVLFNLRYKFEFLGTLKAHQKIYLNIKFINFKTNFFDYLKQDTIEFDYYISPNEKRFINNLYVSDNKKCDHEVKAIHKGENAYIGWDLGQNPGIISSSLYDENGFEVANLPFCDCGPINNDRKFTLVVEKDGCTQSQSLPVYRTLWKKVADADNSILPKGFALDPKGNNKFFRRSLDGKFYTYIHPNFFYSNDLINWKKYKDTKKDKPQLPIKYNSYCCIYSDEYQMATICYTCDFEIVLIEYDFSSTTENKWSNPTFIHNKEINPKWLFSKAVKLDSQNTVLFVVDEDQKYIDFYQVENDIPKYSGEIFAAPKGAKIISIDTLFFLKKQLDNKLIYKSELFYAVLCNNKHVYVYNYNDDYKNNIFEFVRDNQKNIFLIKTNSIYIVLDNYVFELNDREKFTESHFSPKDFTNEETPQQFMIVGEKDSYSFSAAIQTEQKINIWDYKF